MSKADRILLRTHVAVPHRRFGNERAWSVTNAPGGVLRLGQIVHVHAMCGVLTVIKKAIAADKAEQEREVERVMEMMETMPLPDALRLNFTGHMLNSLLRKAAR